MFFTVDPWDDGQGTTETEAFVKEQLASIVGGLKPAARSPPALDLLCVHTVEVPSNFHWHSACHSCVPPEWRELA
jgi:hypothetical protein